MYTPNRFTGATNYYRGYVPPQPQAQRAPNTVDGYERRILSPVSTVD